MNVGYDGGFFATKAVSGDRRVTFPSFVSPAGRITESLLSMNGHQTIDIESSVGRHLVGQEAIKKGVGGRKETGAWINSDEYYSLFLGAMSELTQATQVTVNLVTGLPLNDFIRDKDALRERLLGTHQFTREGRRGQYLKIELVRIVPQGWGAVLSLLLDEKGQVIRPELIRSRVAVLDIGGHNVNYLGVDGLSDVPAESKGTNRGAWNVVRVVRNFIDAEHPGLSRLKDHQVMQAILNGEIWDANERIDLQPITKPVLDDIGEEIVDTASQYWGRNASTYRQVIVIGGGAYLWGDRIRQAFRQAIVSSDPEFTNARGYHNFAVHLAKG